MKNLILLGLFLLPIIIYGQGKHPMGQKLNPKAVSEIQFKAAATTYFALAPKVDLKPYAPRVASQPYVDCYAYASVYTARTILYNITVNETNNPSNNIFSTGFLEYLLFPRRYACKHKGADTHEACKLMEQYGTLPKSDYPSDCSNQEVTPELKQKALHYKIKALKLFEFCASNEAKITSVKNSLSQRKPVVIGINSVSSFHYNGGDPNIWTPTQSEMNLIDCNDANHAVCIIGYDNDKYGGAFEIQNSWGEVWKGDGRVWIRYSDLANFMMFAIELSNP